MSDSTDDSYTHVPIVVTHKLVALGVEKEALEKLQADAARYRYLRNRDPDEVLNRRGPGAGLWIDCDDRAGTLTLVTGEDADKMIDCLIETEGMK
jgi:hypothetical protein